MRRLFVLALTLIAFAAPTSARGQNLLANQSFESGLTGWTTVFDGDLGYAVTGDGGTCTVSFGTGVGCARFTAPGANIGGIGLTQLVETIAGATYSARIVTGSQPVSTGFRYVLRAGGEGGATSTIDCVGLSNCILAFSFTAVGSSTEFYAGIEGYQRGAPVEYRRSLGFLDNASLTLVAQPPLESTVPEPGTWALLGTGLAGLAFTARRRRLA